MAKKQHKILGGLKSRLIQHPIAVTDQKSEARYRENVLQSLRGRLYSEFHDTSAAPKETVI